MPIARHRSHKHFQLDSTRIKRAQKALRAKTETETIESALHWQSLITKVIVGSTKRMTAFLEVAPRLKTFTFELVSELERESKEENKILEPNADDWAEDGKVLARLAEKYDYEKIGRGRLTNDALIDMSAGRLDILVITTNARDFRRFGRIPIFSRQHFAA